MKVSNTSTTQSMESMEKLKTVSKLQAENRITIRHITTVNCCASTETHETEKRQTTRVS